MSFGILALRRRGYRRFEVVIGGLLTVILAAFAITVVRAGVDGPAVVGGLLPRLDGTGSVVLAAGILGATVMPHVIYVHSALARNRYPAADRCERGSHSAPNASTCCWRSVPPVW